MNWASRFQIIFWLAGTVASVVTTVSVIQAIRQYRKSSRQRIAESLMELEDRLEAHWKIMPLLDPASGRYDLELRRAVQASLNNIPTEEREPEDRDLILQLDKFLRFLLLLSSLEKYQLLNREALEYMYAYWFKAVYHGNDDLRKYVDKYFPTLNGWFKLRFEASSAPENPELSNRTRA